MPHYVNGKAVPVVGNDKENLAALKKPEVQKKVEDKPTPQPEPVKKRGRKKRS